MEDDYFVRPPYKGVRMPVEQRAKQFAPFAALTTYDGEIAKEIIRQKQTTRRILSEDSMREINTVLCKLESGDKVKLCYFCEGIYREVVGRVTHNDKISKFLRLSGGVVDDIDFTIKVPYADIYKIERF